MARLLPLNAFLYLLSCFYLFTAAAGPEILIRSGREISATQYAVGKASVTDMIVNWAKKAEGDPTKFAQILKEKAAEPFRGGTGPCVWRPAAECTYIFDGHHRASALHRILFDPHSNLPPEVRAVMPKTKQSAYARDPAFRFRVEAEVRAQSLDELVKTFVRTGKGLLPSEVRNQASLREELLKIRMGSNEPVSPLVLDSFRAMAPDLSKLADDPMRSALGTALHLLDFRTEGMVDYVEFLLGEKVAARLGSLGTPLKAGSELDDEVVRSIQRLLFNDPEMVDYLKSLADPEKKAAIAEQIRLTQEKLRADQRDLKPANANPNKRSCGGRFSRL